MTENLIAEIRQLLEEIVVPELKALMTKLEEIQGQLALREQLLGEQLEAFQAEREAFRAEMAAFREELRGRQETVESGPVRGKRGRYLM